MREFNQEYAASQTEAFHTPHAIAFIFGNQSSFLKVKLPKVSNTWLDDQNPQSNLEFSDT